MEVVPKKYEQKRTIEGPRLQVFTHMYVLVTRAGTHARVVIPPQIIAKPHFLKLMLGSSEKTEGLQRTVILHCFARISETFQAPPKFLVSNPLILALNTENGVSYHKFSH